MKFEQVLPLIKQGKKAFRSNWNGKHLCVYQISKDIATASLGNALEKKFNTYMVIENSKTNTLNTWVPSISDIFADDWKVIN